MKSKPNESVTFKILLKQFFCFHEWSLYRGYYQEKPHSTAHCIKCNKKAVST